MISIEFDNAHGGNLVFSNVTYCPDQPEPCFRAELATPQDQRSSLFSSCSVEYWLGFSSFIPSSWSWVNSGAEQDTIYNFQLHGGDNTGNAPILGIRVQKGAMQANVCGNSAFSSSGSECLYFDLGQVVGGTWADYVIHSQLAFGEPTGFVNIWRNGQLMVSESNILTSYNDLNPPYMKVGSYIPEWGRGMPTGYRWSSVSYTSLRLGNASSSYDDVYTGMGAPCGSACDIGGDNDVKEILLDHTAIFIITVPIGIIMICSCVLYFAHRDQKCAYAEGIANMKPRKKKRNYVASNSSGHDILGTADAVTGVDSAINRNTESLLNKSGSVTRYSASSIASTVSRLSGLVWDDELEYLSVRDPQQAAEGGASMGQEWRSDTTRMVLWYLFGYSVVVIMFVIALILYGRPVAGTRGLLPWTYIHSWTIYQASMIIVSATMVSIYFLPLLFIRHDFDAGRRFVNDPSFLQKIGVVIPCHKSEKEIGEVVKRVIKYIPPGNIIVCDNGNFDGPADNTFQVVKSIHPSIQYCFIKQGHKTRALWTGAHRLPRHVDYIMHLDDDTHLSDSMVFDESHFTSAYNKDHVIAVAFLRSSERINRVTNFTDFWYKITDHFHGTQAYITTRCFVPGPAGVLR